MDTEMSATLDLGPIHLAIGNLTDEVKELKRTLRSIQIDHPVTGTGVCPTPTATFSIDLGDPADGKWWQVRSMMIGGNDITTAPAGVGWVVVMNSAPSANPPLFAVKDFTHSALPQSSFYGSHELIVESSEHLWVVITGGTAGVNYVASGMVEEFPQLNRGSV